MNNQDTVLQDTIRDTENKSSSDKCSGIYGLQNKLKPEKWYVGQTARPFLVRWKDYQYLRCVDQAKIYHALKKNGYEIFDKIILEIIDPNDQVMLNDRENYWIKHFDSISRGYNLREGGVRGKLSAETKARMSAAKKGKKFSEKHKQNLWNEKRRNNLKIIPRKPTAIRGSKEHRRKLVEAWKKRKLVGVSEETKKRISAAVSGVPKSDSHRRNMSRAKLLIQSKTSILSSESVRTSS